MTDARSAAGARGGALERFGLEGRVAVVSGASSGLGAGVARALASAGAKVGLVARRRDRLEALAAELGGCAVVRDLQEVGRCGDAVAEIAEVLGPPEILVAAAGNRFSRTGAEEESLDDIQATINLNLIAPFRMAQAMFPHMVGIGRGSIVFVSSISGHVGVPNVPQASYAASKLGLSGLCSELAVQWARHAIRVNAVAPGFFRSEITESLYADARGKAWVRRHTPLPYDGEVDDVVGSVMWLASDAGRYVTGQTVIVDGGWTAR